MIPEIVILLFFIIGVFATVFIIGFIIINYIQNKPSKESIEKAKQIRRKLKSWEQDIKL